jgi:hypothetical protein
MLIAKIHLLTVATTTRTYLQILSTRISGKLSKLFENKLGGVGHCFAWQGTRPTGGVGENYPVRCSAVREAQNRLLCQAFLFVFYGLPNIFRQKSGYFLQYLQFKFLVWWLSKVSNFGETINFQT